MTTTNTLKTEMENNNLEIARLTEKFNLMEDVVKATSKKVDDMEAAPMEAYTQAECDAIYAEHSKASAEWEEIERKIKILEKVNDYLKRALWELEEIEN
jgi:predicted  nucleic acid-binding Zn-ribbon protein